MRTGTTVTAAAFDEGSRTWRVTVETATGTEVLEADVKSQLRTESKRYVSRLMGPLRA